MTKDLVTRADAVCEHVERIGEEVRKYDEELLRLLDSSASAKTLVDSIQTLNARLGIRSMQLEAVMQVHHDYLDRVGAMSVALRITQIQDVIGGILDGMESYLEAMVDGGYRTEAS